jgi:hypothetical protein
VPLSTLTSRLLKQSTVVEGLETEMGAHKSKTTNSEEAKKILEIVRNNLVGKDAVQDGPFGRKSREFNWVQQHSDPDSMRYSIVHVGLHACIHRFSDLSSLSL